MDEAKAEKEYHKAKMLNPDDPNIQNMSKEQFYEMKRAQLRAFAAELQGLLGMWLMIMALGMEGDDGEPMYNQTWITRKMNMILHKQWNVLHQNVKQIVSEIKKQQRDINKEGKVAIKAEAMLYAPAEDSGKYYADTAGTVDLLAIFSDGTASIYDWKFISPRQVSGFGQKTKIMESPFGSKEDGYNMQIGAYKSILQNFYRVKKVRKSRIIPVHVQYKWKGMKGDKVITPVLDTLRMAYDVEKTAAGKVKLKDGDSYLRPIPVDDLIGYLLLLKMSLNER